MLGSTFNICEDCKLFSCLLGLKGLQSQIMKMGRTSMASLLMTRVIDLCPYCFTFLCVSIVDDVVVAEFLGKLLRCFWNGSASVSKYGRWLLDNQLQYQPFF